MNRGLCRGAALLLGCAALLGACGGDGDGPASGESGQAETTADPSPARPGSKAAAPGVPTSRGADNSIQTWGVEASTAQRARVSALVQDYLTARAERDWGTACAHLAGRPRAEQRRFAQGAGCAEGMASFSVAVPDEVLREEAQIRVLSLRVGGGYGFLIYRRPDGVFATALAREEGRWKVFSVTANQL